MGHHPKHPALTPKRKPAGATEDPAVVTDLKRQLKQSQERLKASDDRHCDLEESLYEVMNMLMRFVPGDPQAFRESAAYDVARRATVLLKIKDPMEFRQTAESLRGDLTDAT